MRAFALEQRNAITQRSEACVANGFREIRFDRSSLWEVSRVRTQEAIDRPYDSVRRLLRHYR